ncbi:MAG: hypothetical protein Ct9H300mP14_01790 [Gammaproteobacteria bacterium]|nr:MAG: hypothetical protein Ct9H300mP14_01790 [Gammaproteobacteria bacterium]
MEINRTGGQLLIDPCSNRAQIIFSVYQEKVFYRHSMGCMVWNRFAPSSVDKKVVRR